MNSEHIMREWFGAVRTVADKAAAMPDSTVLSEVSRRKVSMLLRQYLYDTLESRIIQIEEIPSAEAGKMCKEIYTELMEDIIAGVWSTEENMEIAMFLYECKNGVTDDNTFRMLTEKAFGKNIASDTTKKLQEEARRELDLFCEHRKKQNLLKKTKLRDENEPPQGLDEFEYIDWMITH